ncbi:MAG: tRNA pseudouridine(38-40) synthase TruA [Tissierellia bacterium]|nr:tRNA pseudouridine(38-40) synthase TruA [Tissierellia bacterium]
MRNIKLTIEYDGTNYVGWQKQINGIGIQTKIEEAIFNTTNERVNLTGSGRTDSGVHARGQVANFRTNSSIPGEKFKDALNIKLPWDIAIVESEEVDLDFHSRYDAVAKEYSYLIYNNSNRSPLYRNYSCHVPYVLNFKEMEKGCKYFLGTHDFLSFAGSKNILEDTCRTINNIDLEKWKDCIKLNIEGNGFLYNMVRIIAGTLIDIGRGKIQAEDIPKIIDYKDRKFAGHTAAAEGLYLEKVYY